jgi:hypothetical protein
MATKIQILLLNTKYLKYITWVQKETYKKTETFAASGFGVRFPT